ncbi:Glycosyltransferase involved in cell wall bisynthesis [Rhizobiales bacterium GAS191]|nr:Glycosyltransferase involved in cell wall bisynthesis [Rhizobiales bacterium GAS113]SED55699.1 Glycosyltransferase involved in cell wall bisynthesis [Rhizobiales bacterium GAS191]SEE79478.1 Glycosyltransferase involved in cell wall bisynthesis [Rhizobiales bacterium GAS188]
MQLVVLMPVYEDRASACKLIGELAHFCPVKPFVVVVEDGSLNEPMRGSDIAAAGLDGEIVHLARNLGHQRAIAAGLMHVAGSYRPEAVIVMDSDGEDVPSAIPGLLDALGEGSADVVVAKRRQRTESWQFRGFYLIYRRLFQLLTGRKIRFGNFMALSGRAARRMAAMQEAWVHFPASVMISRLRYRTVSIDRGIRYFGASRMNFVSLILHGMRSIVVFADDVLVRICVFCIGLVAISLFLLALSTVLKLVGMATPGWFSTAWGLLIIILLQAGMLSFITLMVSGTIKGATPMQRTELDLLIDRVEPAHAEAGVTA